MYRSCRSPKRIVVLLVALTGIVFSGSGKRGNAAPKSTALIQVRSALFVLSANDTPDGKGAFSLPAGTHAVVHPWFSCPISLVNDMRRAVVAKTPSDGKKPGEFEYSNRLEVTVRGDEYPAEVDIGYELQRHNETVVVIKNTITIKKDGDTVAVRSKDGKYILLIRWEEQVGA